MAFQVIPFLSKILGKLGMKIAEKGAEQAAKKTAISVAQKIAGAAKTAAAINPQNKSGLSKLLNLITGDLGKNIESTGSMVGRAGELPKGAWFNKVKAAIVGDLGEAAKKAKTPAELEKIVSNVAAPDGAGKIGSVNDIVEKIKPTYERGFNPPPLTRTQFGSQPSQIKGGQKLADTVNNVLFGEGFGSNVLRRTAMGAAQRGIFSGSDVGQPDKDVWGILGNSALGAVAGASMDTMQQQFDYQQQLHQMMSDFNPADEAFKNAQPVMHDKINAFKDYIVNVGMSKKGLQKGKFNSRDMLDIGSKYTQLQKEFGQYEQGDKIYRKAYADYQEAPQKYDPVDFRLASEYWLKNGKLPSKPFLTPAEVNPDTFFNNLSVSNKDSWKPTNQNLPYEMVSPLTSEQKKALAGTYFYTNPGLQKYVMRKEVPKWKQQYGNDQELMKMFTRPDGQFDDNKFAEFMTAYNYGDKIEQNKVDWDKKARYMEQRRDDTEKTAKEQKVEEEKRGYYFTQNYPYDNTQSGPAIVFKKTYSENISPQMLQDATGTKISTDDEIVPVTFEYVDKSGNLVVTAAVNEAGTQRKRRLSIPPGRSKGLLESYFPGITSDAKTAQMFAPVRNEQPIGVYSQEIEDKVSLFMEKNGITDRDAAIKKLKELKIL